MPFDTNQKFKMVDQSGRRGPDTNTWGDHSLELWAPLIIRKEEIDAEAKRLGFAEGIGLSPDGTVSEGAGENLFVIRDGVLFTPGLAHSVLNGITRDTVMRLARGLGYEVRETSIPREMLYIADEIFMTGTAAEVTPVRSVDNLEVGAGKRGPITKAIQEAYFGLVTGQAPDPHGWLQLVDPV